MKNILFITLSLLSHTLLAQLNMSQLGHLDLVNIHSSEASDIWGYVDQSGNEYAIVGLNDGTSIVDVTDPANPVEIFYQPGMNSIWRDIKTWGDYAYVTTEAANGLLIIDMSTLPGNTNLTTTLYTGPTGNEWQSAHNLYIDENGYCYIFGANRGEQGTIILDVHTDPMNPIEVGIQDSYYTHDGVVRGDTLYQAHISDGFFTMYNISDKSNPIYLGQQTTPGVFAHNLWFSDDGDYVYTTDEITNGFIGEFDISDPTNIYETDRIQSSPGDNVIPHNAHFMDNYIITSYYRDGVVIHDVANKGNMVEVGNYDTSPSYSGDGFNGCWGVYPWLPSGNIIASDIENGLHILGVTYQRGCYLEGVVTDASSTNPINDVEVTIIGQSIIDNTDAIGEYETGIAIAGTYDIIYSHPSYYDDTIYGVVLNNGVVTVQDVQLNPIVPVDVTINTLSDLTISLDDAIVELTNDDFNFSGTSAGGGIIFNGVIPGTYNLTVGKWGFITYCGTMEVSGTNSSESITLYSGYYDDFSLDFGWTVSGAAPDGVWERADPNGTTSGGNLINPEDDVTGDCGEMAYVTGNNASGGVGADDVDIADAVLTSPVMNLSSFQSPGIKFNYWWINTGGSGNPNDSLKVRFTDGINSETVAIFTQGNSSSSWQQSIVYPSSDILDMSNIQIVFETADWQADGGHLVEAGIDQMEVGEYASVVDNQDIILKIYPNPSTRDFLVNTNSKTGTYRLMDVSGKLLEQGILNNNQIISVKNAGVYILATEIDGQMQMTKLIKQ
ncbi:MAG: choice-of-anchor B family protein [Flavobacteriales bacterium]|nr:choice-of-anchor B family protein [Flavobacteriales bacterium]MCB9196335.1 choice-of-anchor B family protein [Flavobacteriales bacterium]